MQDVVDGLEGPTDCDVARPSIATDPSTILSTGGMVKALVPSLANNGLVGMDQWLAVAIGWA